MSKDIFKTYSWWQYFSQQWQPKKQKATYPVLGKDAERKILSYIILHHLCSQLQANMMKSCNACVFSVIAQSITSWMPFYPSYPYLLSVFTAEIGSIFQKLRKAVEGEQRICWPAICHVVSWTGTWGSSLLQMNEKGYLGEITGKKNAN